MFFVCNNCYYLPTYTINIADFLNLEYKFTIVLHRSTCEKKQGDPLCLYHQIPPKSLSESTVGFYLIFKECHCFTNLSLTV